MIAARIHWGDAGEWILGAATILALAWAILETRASRKATNTANGQAIAALELERDRNAADTRAREVEQAALVSFAVTGIEMEAAQVKVSGWNYSSVPVFDARWFFVKGPGDLVRASFPWRIDPGPQHGVWEAITVGSSMNWIRRVERLVGLTFTDNAGRRWVKWADGRLEHEGSDIVEQLAGDDAWRRSAPSPMPD